MLQISSAPSDMLPRCFRYPVVGARLVMQAIGGDGRGEVLKEAPQAPPLRLQRVL